MVGICTIWEQGPQEDHIGGWHAPRFAVRQGPGINDAIFYLSAVNQQGDRSIIDDVDLHQGTEATRLGIDAQFFNLI